MTCLFFAFKTKTVSNYGSYQHDGKQKMNACNSSCAPWRASTVDQESNHPEYKRIKWDDGKD